MHTSLDITNLGAWMSQDSDSRYDVCCCDRPSASPLTLIDPNVTARTESLFGKRDFRASKLVNLYS